MGSTARRSAIASNPTMRGAALCRARRPKNLSAAGRRQVHFHKSDTAAASSTNSKYIHTQTKTCMEGKGYHEGGRAGKPYRASHSSGVSPAAARAARRLRLNTPVLRSLKE